MNENDITLLRPFFWDVDITTLDIVKHRRFIIERLLMFGRPEQVKWVLEHYSREEIVETIKKSKAINRKTASYWSIHFDIPREEIVCFNRQLMQPLFY
ncbi:MAG: hypothetical protein GF350_12235 [Chitinivibrionales bacterium]|nr:hypothetical protein [Chitinivibrionales bacterium]